MKLFILKSIFFVLPFFIGYVWVNYFIHSNDGDLLRLGYIIDNSDYRTNFQEAYKKDIYGINLSSLNLNKENNFTVLTIGDSFSEQKNISYKNYLAENEAINLVHFNRSLHNDPLQTLVSVSNGNLLDSLNIKFIILQLVERNFAESINNLNDKKILHTDSLTKKINKQLEQKETKKKKAKKLFSDKIIKVPLVNILYNFQDKPYGSKTYKVTTSTPLFSDKKSELLFFEDDLKALKKNEAPSIAIKLNETLNIVSNKLEQKGVQLIFLPGLDKYDAYYDQISKKEIYPKPIFFEQFNQQEKQYIYVDSKEVLSKAIKEKKDVYYYDDSHWSPVGTQLIAEELFKMIQTNTIK